MSERVIEEGGTSERAEARELLTNSAIISSLVALGIVSGFLIDALVAAVYGMGPETDAFFIAYTAPITLVSILVTACNQALIPIFTRQAKEPGRVEGFLNVILSSGLVASGLLTLMGVLFPRGVIVLLGPGLTPPWAQLAVELTRVLFVMVLFSGLAAILQSFLYSQRSFAVPSMIDVVQNGFVILAILLVGRSMGIMAVAVGYVVGSGAKMMLLAVMAWRRFHLKLRLSFEVRHPGVKEAGGLITAPLAGLALRRASVIVERALASYLPAGSITALAYADKISFVMAGIFLGSVMTAFLPSLSASVAGGKPLAVRRDLSVGFRIMSFVSIPLGLGLSLLSIPLVRLIFQRGAFGREATLVTGSVLGLYSLSLIFMGHFRVMQNYYYAALKPGKIILLFFAATLLNIIFALLLVSPMDVRGLALAFSLGTALATGLGYLLMRKDLPTFPWRQLAIFDGKVVSCSAVMSLVVYGLSRWLKVPGGAWSQLWLITLTTGAGIASFAVMAALLRLRELGLIFDLLRKTPLPRRKPRVEEG